MMPPPGWIMPSTRTSDLMAGCSRYTTSVLRGVCVDNNPDLAYVLRDLAHLTESVEQRFYDPTSTNPAAGGGGPGDGVRVSTGNNAGISTQAPCDISHLDLLVSVDAVIALLPDQAVVGLQRLDPSTARSGRSRVLSLVALLVEEGDSLPAAFVDAITSCWTEFRRAFGLVVLGQRSLHEPMTLEEIAGVLQQPLPVVKEWSEQDLLERWQIGDRVLWRIPKL